MKHTVRSLRARALAALCPALAVLLALAGCGGSSQGGGYGFATSSGPLRNGSVVPTSVTVHVTGEPAAKSVRWQLDGALLANDEDAPFEVSIAAAPGKHTLKARVETSAGSQTIQAEFESRGASAPSTGETSSGKTSSGKTSSGKTSSGKPSSNKKTSSNKTSPTVPKSTGSKAPSPSIPGAVAVSSAAELTDALGAAAPGQTIELADGVYAGEFTATASGTADAPIRLVGGRGAVLQGASTSSGYALHLDGASYWILQGFSMTSGQKGLVLDGASHNLIDGVDVGNVGQEGVHFRAFSSDNTLQNSVVHDTGLTDPQYGEGVYIGSAESNWSRYSGGRPDASDGNQVLNNTITAVAAEAVDIKEGTANGTIAGNTMDGGSISGQNFADSYIDAKGNGYTVSGNTMRDASAQVLDGIQTHEIVDGDGSDNTFADNAVDTTLPGYAFNIDPKTHNTVACSNQAGGAAMGLSNVACS